MIQTAFIDMENMFELFDEVSFCLDLVEQLKIILSHVESAKTPLNIVDTTIAFFSLSL